MSPLNVSVADLPHLNAALNATSAILLIIGWSFYQGAQHRGAPADDDLRRSSSSALFLTSYVIYHAQIGSKPFPGTGAGADDLLLDSDSARHPGGRRAAAGASSRCGADCVRDDARHRRIAKITLPLWLFVSVTGVIVYLMLYHWPQASTLSGASRD